jgi:hypothetical protein
LRNCRNVFQDQEYSPIERFIQRHKEDGVLLLKATYQIEIIERTKSEKKMVAAQMPFAKKKVAEKV